MLLPALIKAKLAMEPARKNQTNPHFRSKYADLASVIEAVEAALSANDLVLVQTIEIAGAETHLLTTLYHASGESLSSVYPLRPAKDDPQGMGSALTYARRYSILAICGVAPEDDDGNAASARERGDSGRAKGNPQPDAKRPAEPTPEAPGATPTPTDAITPEQVKALMAALDNIGYGGAADEAREARLRWSTDRIGRPITSAKELTKEEASKLISEAEKIYAERDKE
jgi:hypothetical protein